MTQTTSPYTTIRINKDIKEKLDSITLKSETYSEVIEQLINESHAIKAVEKSIVRELEKKRYVKFEDIDW